MSLGSVIRGVLPFALLLFNAGSTPVGAFQAAHTGGSEREQILVKVRNGKTGLPIWLASPYVYVGKVDIQHRAENQRKTAFWNDAHVDVSGANPRRVTVVVDFVHRDCRYAASDGSMEAAADFDLDVILSTGVVAPNLCSSKRQAPEPGVLTIYVIPSTFEELWNR